MNVTRIDFDTKPVFMPLMKHDFEFTRITLADSYGIHIAEKSAWFFDKNVLWWILVKNFTIWVSFDSGGCWEFSFGKGFNTDGASVPRMLNGIVQSFDPRIFYGALMHDLAYQTKDISKKDADELLSACCAFYGYKGIDRLLIGKAVEWFGGDAYNSSEEREAVRCGRIRRYMRDKDGVKEIQYA